MTGLQGSGVAQPAARGLTGLRLLADGDLLGQLGQGRYLDTGDAVEDPGTSPPRCHEPGRRQRLELRGGVAHLQPGRRSQFLHPVLALR